MNYGAFHYIPWQYGTFWVTVAIVIFAILFARRIAAPLTAMLDRRGLAVREALDEAARLNAEAQAMLADARKKQEQAMQDAKDILVLAHDEAARLAAQLRAEAAAAAQWRERLAMDRISAAEHAALTEVRAAAIDIASKATAQTLRETFSGDADSALLDHAISDLPRALRSA